MSREMAKDKSIYVIGLILLEIVIGLLALSLHLTAIFVLCVVSGILTVLSVINPIFCYGLLILLLPFSVFSIFQIGKLDFRIADPFAVLMFFVLLFHGFMKREVRLEKSFIDFPLILLFAWIALSALWSVSWSFSLAHITKIFYGVLIFYLSVNVIKNEREVNTVVKVWHLMAVVLVVIALHELITVGLPRSAEYGFGTITHWGDPVRTAGFEEGPNRLGFTMNLCIMLFIPSLLVQTSKRRMILMIIALFAMLLVVVTTMSRSSWLSLSAGCMIFALTSKKFRKIFALAVISGVIGLVILRTNAYVWLLIQRLFTFFRPAEEVISNRVMNWKVGMEIFQDHALIGVGSGAFKIIKGDAPHSLVLDLLSGTGLVGLSLFLFMMVAILHVFISFLRNCQGDKSQKREFYMAVGFAAGVIVFLVQGLFTSFRLKEYEMWAFLGLAMASLRIFSMKNNGSSERKVDRVMKNVASPGMYA